MISKRLSIVTLVLTLVLALAPVAHAQDDISAQLLIDTAQGEQQMTLTASGDDLMLEMEAGPQGSMAIVWTGTVTRMIMHSQRMYMEFTQEMMERMRAMGGAMAGGNQPDEPALDPDDMSAVGFERTGATDTINGVSAFEVEVTGPDGHQAMLWMTEEREVGLMEVMALMATALSEMQMPGMQGGASGLERMQDFNALAGAQGMPNGVVIRVVDARSGTTITVGEISEGPFPASMFEAPEGYTKQSMPFQN